MAERIDLFDAAYYGANSEDEFLKIMREIGWHEFYISSTDYPRRYPVLFRVEVECSPNSGRDYPSVFFYYEDDLRNFSSLIQDLL